MQRPKPTIAELEELLSSEKEVKIQIAPDGSVSTYEPAFTRPFPDPTEEMIASPEFEAVWQCIKRWDINVPDAYAGYCGAMGNHVRAILDALAAVKSANSQPIIS